MSKFKIKMKLQGFELEIEGSKDDIPLIAQNVGQQIAGLIQPSAAIVEGDPLSTGNGRQHPLTIDNSDRDVTKSRKPRRTKRSGGEPQNSVETPTIEWRHDPAKYGNPKQDWNAASKALWLIYVVSQELEYAQLSVTQISNTFNRKFKQSGTIRPSNISRDLGTFKTKNPALVGDDTTKSSTEWFPTDAGIRKVQELIVETLSPAP
ncbi:hypothetical protein P3C58_20595 [Mesorhizobium sp. XAP10]|uniref:hypothetical protein n=1 Tax=unclassified Mesorhizobium TaxID=325217 RepID=UPI0023DF323B|nr:MULTISPECIES: hypothetical protein [unclassified Mesorhizobium]MDF3154382.1 hypothetical protein [Mesorhizobium sp. XAP10]MDF3246849.1 hypothetical protein [Mesorhizobium sp. XAP4]